MRRKMTILDVLKEAQDAVVGGEEASEGGPKDRAMGGTGKGKTSPVRRVRRRQGRPETGDPIEKLRGWLNGKIPLSRALVLWAGLGGLFLVWGAYGLGASSTRAAPVELGATEDGESQDGGEAQDASRLPEKKPQTTPDRMNQDSTGEPGRVVPVGRPSEAPEYRIADFFQINTVLNKPTPRGYCKALVEDLQAKGFRAMMRATDASRKHLAVYIEIPEDVEDPEAFLEKIRRLDPPDRRKVTFDYSTIDGRQRVTGRTLVK